MTGNDCKILEDNIDTFLFTFLKTGEKFESESCLNLRQVLVLYKVFKNPSMVRIRTCIHIIFHQSVYSRKNSFSASNNVMFNK